MERELSLSLVFLVCLPAPVAGQITGRFAVGCGGGCHSRSCAPWLWTYMQGLGEGRWWALRAQISLDFTL